MLIVVANDINQTLKCPQPRFFLLLEGRYCWSQFSNRFFILDDDNFLTWPGVPPILPDGLWPRRV